MTAGTKALGRGLVWFAAANFAALVVGGAALAALGAISPARWRGALMVLGGSAQGVQGEELDRLRTIERAYAERTAVPSEAVLLRSWRALRAERVRLLARGAEQWARLSLLAGLVEGERARVDAAESAWRLAREDAERQRLERQRALEATASEKLQRVYRYMRADAIAADLEARMDAGQGGEVAQIVRSLPDRSAAEVLESFADPAKRNRIYDLIAGRKVPEVPASREATP